MRRPAIPLYLAVGILVTAGACLADPLVPDSASDTAEDILAQLADGIIPPVPNVVGAHAPDPGPPTLSVPVLPDPASEIAVDVLAQLAEGTIPPLPIVAEGHRPDLGSGTDAGDLASLPSGDADTCNPDAAMFSAISVNPEPSMLSLVVLGSLVALRRKRN